MRAAVLAELAGYRAFEIRSAELLKRAFRELEAVFCEAEDKDRIPARDVLAFAAETLAFDA